MFRRLMIAAVAAPLLALALAGPSYGWTTHCDKYGCPSTTTTPPTTVAPTTTTAAVNPCTTDPTEDAVDCGTIPPVVVPGAPNPCLVPQDAPLCAPSATTIPTAVSPTSEVTSPPTTAAAATSAPPTTAQATTTTTPAPVVSPPTTASLPFTGGPADTGWVIIVGVGVALVGLLALAKAHGMRAGS